jgi:soluble lytic murein transglycosylase-like protein
MGKIKQIVVKIQPVSKHFIIRSLTRPIRKFTIKPLLCLLIFLFSASANSTIYRYIDPQGRLVFTDKPKHSGYIRLEKTLAGWTVARKNYSWKSNQRRFSPTIERVADKYRLSHHLVHAVNIVESAYNPSAISKAGAQGLMQLMPATASRFGVNDPYNPHQNIEAGTEYLKHLMGLFKNNLSLALAAYNAGENAVKKYNNRIPPYKETQNYVKKVLKYYRKYAAKEKNR